MTMFIWPGDSDNRGLSGDRRDDDDDDADDDEHINNCCRHSFDGKD